MFDGLREVTFQNMKASAIFLLVFLTIATCSDNEIAPDSGKKGGGMTKTETEPTPLQKARKKLLQLQGDMLSNIKKFEDMAAGIAVDLSGGSHVATDLVDISIHEFTVKNFERSASLEERIIDFENGSYSSIEIPVEKIRKLPKVKSVGKITVVTAWWKNKDQINIFEKGRILPKESSMMSVSYFPDLTNPNSRKESLPVNYYMELKDKTEIPTMSPNEKVRGVERVCAWVNLTSNSWSTEGCVAKLDGKGIKCECEHTTTFVTLLLLDTELEFPTELDTISIVFEATSVVCLFFTIIFISVARHGAGIDSSCLPQATGMNFNRTNSQISLCAALWAFHFVIVWHELASNDYGCVAFTVLSHYFLLASAFWSLCEGVGIFVKMFSSITMVMRYRTLTIIQTIIGWGVPLIITATTAAYGITHEVYMDESEDYIKLMNEENSIENISDVAVSRYRECWLSRENNTIWAALAPLIFVMVVNLVILCYVTKEVVKMKRKNPIRELELSDSQSGTSKSNSLPRSTPPPLSLTIVTEDPSNGPSIRTADLVIRHRRWKYLVSIIRSFGILMPILSVPWILAILSNIPSTGVALSTAHTVVNGLQGLQIFLLYCVANKRDWKIVKRKWRNSELKRLLGTRRYGRRDSAPASPRIPYEPKFHQTGVDSNGNNYLGAGWKGGIPMTQYDTLSSGRSSSGTIYSAQSLQRRQKSPSNTSCWWWRK